MTKFSSILLIGSASGILVAQLDIIMTSLLTVEADAAVGSELRNNGVVVEAKIAADR